MKWKKLGRIFEPPKDKNWNQLYAMMPTPVYLEDRGIIRVFFGTTDTNRFGRSSYIDLNSSDPTKVVYISPEPILDLGRVGTFDDSGVIASSVVHLNSQFYLYYVGFQRTVNVPYMLFSGLAIGQLDCMKFTRYSESPIIDRSRYNVFSNAAPFVLYDDDANLFKMWCWLGKEWISIRGKFYIKAEIGYAESTDGLSWSLAKNSCIIPREGSEFSVGRPWVKKLNHGYEMFYSVRWIDKLYRLGYARSEDGKDWIRDDENIGIDVSETGWDSEMICYPAVLTIKNRTFLFYNGNNNGETGFGVAELIED